MKPERLTKPIIYLTVSVWTVLLYLNHRTFTSSLLKPLSTVTTVVLYAVMAFDLWLWRLPWLHWFVKRPFIDGIWKVEMRSDWKDPSTGSPISPVEGYMVIRQTLSTLSMRLLTAESSSELVGTEIVCSADRLYCVSGVYRNEPRYEVRDRSPIHYGGVWLRVSDEPPKQLSGHYWTDRKTAGEIYLTDQRSKKLQTFESSRAYYAHS
jgi:hypothetical protein